MVSSESFGSTQTRDVSLDLEDIDALKHCIVGEPRYRLSRANVFVSGRGFHYIDYLDPIEVIDPQIHGQDLNAQEIAYIENQLQANNKRFEAQVEAVRRVVDPVGKRALDIGCGGGIFLAKLRAAGAAVIGLELSDSRAAYASQMHALEVIKRPVEDAYWGARRESFDIVTLWDVIEHVNHPIATLEAAVGLLRPGGWLFIDTPCRDAFYHRAGELTYRISGGRFPTFLNAMYSAHPFGHKQIFATHEMKEILEQLGLVIQEMSKFHELSFPVPFYLRKLFRSEALVRLLHPIVILALAAFPVRNKLLAVGQKPRGTNR